MRKRIKIFIVILMMVLFNINFVYATEIKTDNFEPAPLTYTDYGKAFEMTSTIVGTITSIGVVISIVMLMVLGIKYMMGSVEEKAEYKKTLYPMLVGTILLFISSTIVAIIYQLVTQL